MFINEKLHSPLFGYSEQIKRLYYKVCDELNKKIHNDDFIYVDINNDRIDYIAKYIKIKIELNEIGIDIVKLTKPINFHIYDIDDIKFKNYFNDNKGTRNLIYGDIYYSSEQYIKDDIMYIDDNDFNCYIYSYNGKIDPKSFYLLFYHEFNHLYRRYNILKNNNEIEKNNDIIQANITNDLMNNIRKNNSLSNIDKGVLCDVVYMLLDKDELYAFANSIKGELINVYKNAEGNVEEIFKRTEIYKEYLRLKRCYEYINDMDPEKLYKLCIIYNNVYEKYNYKNRFKKYYDNGDDIKFKEKLLMYIKRNLDLFKRQIINIYGTTELMENYIYVKDIKHGRRDGKDMWIKV